MPGEGARIETLAATQRESGDKSPHSKNARKTTSSGPLTMQGGRAATKARCRSVHK